MHTAQAPLLDNLIQSLVPTFMGSDPNFIPTHHSVLIQNICY